MNVKMLLTFRLAIAGVMIGLGSTVQAGDLLVTGSPGYDQTTNTGLKNGPSKPVSSSAVNNNGVAVGYSYKYDSGSNMGYRAVYWDASGTLATELDNLSFASNGFTNTYAYAINAAGTAVGQADIYVGGINVGWRAVRWDASGTTATELDNLGTNSTGLTYAVARAVNNSGTAVGDSNKYVSGNFIGSRAVRWDASGTAATELGILDTSTNGWTDAMAYAVNDAGTAVGYSEKYVGGSDKGARAVRWDASGTVAIELDNLGTDASGVTYSRAYAINEAGIAVGYSKKYIGDSSFGTRAVRWDASGTTATELGILGTQTNEYMGAIALAVNSAGTAVGNADKYVSGNNLGSRAVRWDASGTAATELANLGTDANGVATSWAIAVNDAGTTVGFADKYVNGSSLGRRAVMWLPDASAIDLNDLGVAPAPAGGTWTLTKVKAISADGWITGEGTFDPDSSGPLVSYTRLWVAQVGLGGTWTQATGGTWGRGPNWSTGTPAMQVGNAMFNLNSSYTVALDRDELTKTIAINAGTVTINCNGHTLSTESGLSIANGATLKGTGTIISDILNAGTLQLSGTGTIGSVANSATLEVLDGSYVCGNVTGTGSLLIDAGSSLTATSVTQNTVTLSVGARLTITPIPGGPSAGASSISSVPEPSVWVMLMLAALGLGVYWRRH
jgi:hypothetical protein